MPQMPQKVLGNSHSREARRLVQSTILWIWQESWGTLHRLNLGILPLGVIRV